MFADLACGIVALSAPMTSDTFAARREYLLEFIHLLPNGFSTPTTTTLAFIKAGYNVTFEPIDAGELLERIERDGTTVNKYHANGASPAAYKLRIEYVGTGSLSYAFDNGARAVFRFNAASFCATCGAAACESSRWRRRWWYELPLRLAPKGKVPR